MDFGEENGAKLASKSHPTCGFLKIRKMPFGASPLAPNEVRGVQVGSQNRSKIDQKLKSTWEGLLDSIFLDFDGFWEGKWRQVGTKIDQKSMSVAKREFLKNRALPTAGARFFKIRGSKLGAKIDQKSVQK